MPKFSFVIPTYNCKCLLRNTLEALNYQTGYGRDDYEVIVIDDGSVDQTQDYINGINHNYDLKYIYLNRDGHSGRSRARNCGWKTAAGAIIVFIDADIIVKPHHLSELERFYRYESNLAVLGNRLMLPNEAIDFAGLFDRYRFENCNIWSLDTPYFIFDLLSYNAAAIRTPGLLLATNNSAVPKKYLEAVGGFDEKFMGWGCEDLELGFRLQLETDLKFAINSKLEVLHQYHERNFGDDIEYKKNLAYFKSKYAGSHSRLPLSQEYEMWSVREMPRDQYRKRYLRSAPQKCKKIEFRDLSDLGRLKETIVRFSARQEIDLEINDHVENSDLDIWIQLLGIPNSAPKYYPVSKKIGAKRGIRHGVDYCRANNGGSIRRRSELSK